MNHNSKSLRRKSGRNKKNYPLFKNVWNGEGVHRIMIKSPVMTYSDHRVT